MDKQEPPFDTQAYANYVALLKEKEEEWNEFVLNKYPIYNMIPHHPKPKTK